MNKWLLVLICFVLASCVSNSVKFIPVSDKTVREDGAEHLVARGVITLIGGKILFGDEYESFGRLAMTLPVGVKVKQDVVSKSGLTKELLFLLTSEQLIVIDDDQIFKIELVHFRETSAVGIRKVSNDSLTLFKNIFIYFKMDASKSIF